MLTLLTVNLAGAPRRVSLNDRTYVVCPLTLLVPGVLAGSSGPIMYPAEAVSRNAADWNGTPVTLGHPTKGGRPVSASDPAVLARVGIGFIANACANGKLRADGWFDAERVARADPDLLERIESGQRVELSTGVFIDTEPAPLGATHNGRVYHAVVRNMRPDHLAVLRDQTGACSLADGCGVNVRNAAGCGCGGGCSCQGEPEVLPVPVGNSGYGMCDYCLEIDCADPRCAVCPDCYDVWDGGTYNARDRVGKRPSPGRLPQTDPSQPELLPIPGY